MAVRSLARSGIGTGGKYISFLAGNEAFSPDSDILIQEQLIASNTTSVTFSSIPTTYKHLQIRLTARTDLASTGMGSVLVRINSDSTSTNYYSHLLYGTGSAVSSGAPGNDSGLLFAYSAAGGNSSANIFGAGVMDILDYQGNKNKTAKVVAGGYAGNTRISLNSAIWFNTATISSLTIVEPNGANFVSGSRFSLYGSLG